MFKCFLSLKKQQTIKKKKQDTGNYLKVICGPLGIHSEFHL